MGTYPFYRPQDRGNPKEVQIMIQRILRMQYKIPESSSVSPELRDLLSKILVEDPTKRISMREIMDHPWYRKDLPEGVVEMNDELPLPGDDVQPLQDVKRILQMAQSPIPGTSPKQPGGSNEIGEIVTIPEETSQDGKVEIEPSVMMSTHDALEPFVAAHANSSQPSGMQKRGSSKSRSDEQGNGSRSRIVARNGDSNPPGGELASNDSMDWEDSSSCLSCIRWTK